MMSAKKIIASILLVGSVSIPAMVFASTAPSLETVCEFKINEKRVSFRDWDKVTWATSAPTETRVLDREYQGPLHSLKKTLNVQMRKGEMYYEVSMLYSEITDLEVYVYIEHDGGEKKFDKKKGRFSNKYNVADNSISVKCNPN